MLRVFFKMENNLLQNITSVFWKRLMEPVSHLTRKKLTDYIRKQKPKKNSP